jgi:ATP-dependent exoDNAse (exonuclease V) beta subunit
MTRPMDWQAREAALDTQRSFIVQAPAGSGKTELLTQRMLSLLARVENPEEVVAITFTRKAAAEMKHRMLKGLLNAQQAVDEAALEPHERLSRQLALAVLENDRERGWGLLEQPGRLRVRTIDSLCGELARQLPLLSGLGGGQQVTERAEDLYRQAAIRTLSAIEEAGDELQADVERVLSRYANQYDRLVDLVTAMLGNRDQWLGFLLEAQAGGFDRAALEGALDLLIERELQHAADLLPEWLLSELPRFLHFCLEHEPEDEAAVRALIEDCESGGVLHLETEPLALRHWQCVINRLQTASGDWRKDVNKKLGFPAKTGASAEDQIQFSSWKDEYIDLLDRLRSQDDALREQLAVVRGLPDPQYSDEAWMSLHSLVRILVRAAQEWNVVMAETGGADFIEIASRAIEALGDEGAPSDLALRLDYRIQHLLVDEFQDTSHNQVRLLQHLTAGWSAGDGHTLFLVGDPMQSIYRFRKAEVSLFIRAFQGGLFDQLSLNQLRLGVNFRSTAPIVEWVNLNFPRVMPGENDTVTGAVPYSPSQPRPGAETRGTVTLQIAPRRDDAEEALEVERIVRACEPDDKVAILVRSRNHASEILSLFDRLKQDEPRFRYRAVDFNSLGETTLVRDLVSLTLALTQAADRLSWLSVLRTPFCGLDLADLDTLAGGRDTPLVPDAISACLGDSESRLSAGGMERIRRTGPILLEAASRYGRVSVRDLAESAWLRLGGPACVHNRSELSDASTYFDLVSALESEGLPVDRDNLDKRLEKLFAEPDAEASDCLQVMTIYSAKGLQFDTVILPGLNRDTRNNDGKLLYWFELADADQVVMCPMRDEKEKRTRGGDLVQYIGDVEKRRQAMENGRLMYVAATRAVHSLHLLAAVKPTTKGQVRPGGSTLLGTLWPAVEETHTAKVLELAEQLGEPPPSDEGLDLPQRYRRLPQDWILSEPPQPVSRTSTEPASPPDYVEYRWAGENARLTGNLVHRLLQQVAENGRDAWIASGGTAAHENWCRQQLRTGGVTGKKADGIMKQTGAAIESCLASEKARWLLADHEDSACEYAITAVLENTPVNLVLDRTFVENGTRWIVDYKTGVHAGGNLEAFLESEADRYRPQLERYREAMALTESRPIRTALYFPLLDRFVEL